MELDRGKVIGWRDLINDRTAAYDDNGHGTHVASIAAGRAVADVSGSTGGVAPGAGLVGVKVLDERGSAPMSTVIRGIEWCVANRAVYGIRILNLSLGSSRASDGNDSVSRAVDAATAVGISVVCAAGNSGPRQLSVGSPAAADGALTVGALADPAERGIYAPSWSSRGPTVDGRVKPDIMAPGVGINAARANSTNGYVTFSGTSMASPFVAGYVALMLQSDPSLTPADVRRTLVETAGDRGPVGADSDYDYRTRDVGSYFFDVSAGLAPIESAGPGQLLAPSDPR